MARYKFDDCKDCRFKRKPDVCNLCDYGEQFEPKEVAELSFKDEEMFARANKPLTNDADEPDFNPDDLIRQIEENDEEEDLIDDDEDKDFRYDP